MVTVTSPAQAPFDEEQLRILAEARTLTKKLRVAQTLALLDVIGLTALGIVTLGIDALSLELSPIGLALLVLAYNEARGRSGLLALARGAPIRLALNQIALFAVVLAYCAWNAYATWTGPNPLETIAAQSGELTTALRQLDAAGGQDGATLWRWIRLGVLIGYGAVAAGSLVVQGAMAYYYRSLRRVVDGLARLPEWARTVR